MSKYELNIIDKTTNRTWTEYYDSYYLLRKRIIKLSYSKKLHILSLIEN